MHGFCAVHYCIPSDCQSVWHIAHVQLILVWWVNMLAETLKGHCKITNYSGEKA